MGVWGLKYSANPSFIAVGVGLIIISIINLVLSLILLFSGENLSATAVGFVVICILGMFLGFNYLRISKRDYIIIDSRGILIDQGFLRGKKLVRFEEIDIVRKMDGDLRLGLKSGNELRIKLKMLTIKNIDKLYSLLDSKVAKNN